jgi:hypothetical protein
VTSIAISVIFMVAIPFIVMAMLVSSLKATAPRQPNYRGVPVFNGLGIVWFVWLVSFWVGAHILEACGVSQPAWITYLVPLFPLLAGSCAFGLLDDWVGDRTAKGFKGHLRALRHGRITTGGLKMIGIGALSLFTAVSLYWGSGVSSAGLDALPRIVLATCVMALSANLLNLFDLRPGRAGKVYLLGLVVAVVCVAAFGVITMSGWSIAALALAGLGPLVAVWRYDLGEVGMLGDAGANSMGAFLGYLYATALPLWALLAVCIVLFVVNGLSERVSFSAIVEKVGILRILDGLGRKHI